MISRRLARRANTTPHLCCSRTRVFAGTLLLLSLLAVLLSRPLASARVPVRSALSPSLLASRAATVDRRAGGSGATALALRRVFEGKRVFVLSHEVSATGAPRLCAELAVLLREAGASVTFSTSRETGGATLERLTELVSGLVPGGAARLTFDVSADVGLAAESDLVIVSSADTRQARWVQSFRAAHPRFSALVWWIHEGATVMSVYPSGTARRAAEIMTTPGLVDALVFPSESTRDWWAGVHASTGQAPSASIANAHVVLWGIPHWRDADFRRAAADVDFRASLRAAQGFSEDDFVFVSLASYHRIKGHAGIVAALRSARPVCARRLRLVSAGAGLGTASWLRKQDHFPTAAFDWALDDADIRLEGPTHYAAEYLAAADAFVSNTKVDGETWGLATLEALAMGLPVLASDVGGSREQLEHNVTALLHAVARVARVEDDADAEVPQLARHMCAVATDAALRKRITDAATAKVRGAFSQENMERQLVRVFGDALKK